MDRHLHRSTRAQTYATRQSLLPWYFVPSPGKTIKLIRTAPNNQADNIITTNDARFHLRARTLLTRIATGKGAMVNMTDRLIFFTMDVLGDLAFGESFGCLKNGGYHSWVRTLFSYLKGMSLAAAPRYYLTTEFLFEKLIPTSMLEEECRHGIRDRR
ncbi:MAG: hypothetical protein Q9184_004350 [Pyrenodesmia sp. 2 TL-2023]